MIARYEQLRRLALGRCAAQAQGLALFMRRGMRAWMLAWSPYVPPPLSGPAAPLEDEQICPVQLHAEIATLMANMVLLAREEVLA